MVFGKNDKRAGLNLTAFEYTSAYTRHLRDRAMKRRELPRREVEPVELPKPRMADSDCFLTEGWAWTIHLLFAFSLMYQYYVTKSPVQFSWSHLEGSHLIIQDPKIWLSLFANGSLSQTVGHYLFLYVLTWRIGHLMSLFSYFLLLLASVAAGYGLAVYQNFESSFILGGAAPLVYGVAGFVFIAQMLMSPRGLFSDFAMWTLVAMKVALELNSASLQGMAFFDSLNPYVAIGAFLTGMVFFMFLRPHYRIRPRVG